jgi:hypothetical protein
MDNTKRIAELEEQIDAVYKDLQKLDDLPLDRDETYEEYMRKRSPHYNKIGKLDREQRLLKTPEFSELPKFGNVMSLKDFIENVAFGMFIDSDGSGNYVKDGKMSNISVRPSDVKHKSLRPDFDTMIWFNK